MANERFVPLLYSYLTAPPLQEGAAECLTEILFKKMPADKKWALLQQLRVVQHIAQLTASAAGAAAFTERFAEKTGILINTFGGQIMNCMGEIKSYVVPSP